MEKKVPEFMNINIKEIEKEAQEVTCLVFSVSSLWQEDRPEAIKRLYEGVKTNRAAVYGIVKLSDKGPEDIKKVYANIFSSSNFSRKGWWRCSGVFIDGSFFAVSEALATENPIEATLEVVLYGYEVNKKELNVEAGKVYNLGEILIEKVYEGDRTAGIKGKVVLSAEKSLAGVKVETWFRSMPSCCSDGPAAQTYTSEDGSFYLKGLQPGEYFIKLSHLNFLFTNLPGSGYELGKDTLLDIGEIKATPSVVIHIEWIRAKEVRKDFKESLRGKEVLKFEDKQCEFNFGRPLGIYDGCVLFSLTESTISVFNDRHEFDLAGNLIDTEDYIIDLGKISMDEAIKTTNLKDFSPETEGATTYFEGIKEGHSYLLITENCRCLGIIRIAKIETGECNCGRRTSAIRDA